jgi:hypothetical protein
MRAAYLEAARDQSRVVNYLAQQVLESAGKLPEIKIQPPAGAAPGVAPGPAPTTSAPTTPQPAPTSAKSPTKP